LIEASDPSRVMMRHIAGSFAQYEKARLVRKLREARDRKKAENPRRRGGTVAQGNARRRALKAGPQRY
jgi:hypothetical protein